ncbi:NAD(P)-binding domain-containing protein [Candidatus Kaiserbacteria bacterium]|nr:NAD(P)-binding domain-containing protein [Candidatus Kaiserbacteria bacterium]
MKTKIAIIGGGHIGTALREGLVQSGVARKNIAVSDSPRDNAGVTKKADLIFIAVKPTVVPRVLTEIREAAKGKAIISLAAGVKVYSLQKWLGRAEGIGRIMPNMPIASTQGIVGLYGSTLSRAQRARVRKLLGNLGLFMEVKKEKELDALSLIAGCGPAVAAYFVETLARSGVKLGFTKSTSEALAYATFAGTLAYLRDAKISPSELIRAVATKGGVTETMLSELEKDVPKSFARALKMGKKHIRKIGKK